MRNYVRDLIGTVLLAVVLFFLLRMVIGNYQVFNVSMQPGLYEGERLLVNKMAYTFSEPDRGEIIVFRSPTDGTNLIKRVIGLPGDLIEVKNGIVYVNTIGLNEPYVRYPATYTMTTIQVPLDQYFVLGDNRNNSSDSHVGWTVPKNNLIGRAWVFTWPPDKWGSVNNYPLDNQILAEENP